MDGADLFSGLYGTSKPMLIIIADGRKMFIFERYFLRFKKNISNFWAKIVHNFFINIWGIFVGLL